MAIAVILAAAGASTRMGGDTPKPLLFLAGQPVLSWSLARFAADRAVCQILVMAPAPLLSEYAALCAPYPQASVWPGGETRAASVALALSHLRPEAELIAIHDAARPLLSARDWQALCAAAREQAAVIAAGPPVDTIKLLAADGSVQQGLPRQRLAAAQTPQIFRRALFEQLCRSAGQIPATDEAELAEALGQPVTVVMSQDANFKLTFPEDIPRAAAVLQERQAAAAGHSSAKGIQQVAGRSQRAAAQGGAAQRQQRVGSDLPADKGIQQAAGRSQRAAAQGGAAQRQQRVGSDLPADKGIQQAAGRSQRAAAQSGAAQRQLRVGSGWDRHRLVAGRRLVLGGVEIPAPFGCLGHSDGDPLLHAIIDALFGAAAGGDIGAHFPDSDPAWAGADSRELLARCVQELRRAGWRPLNVDATILLQKPHLQAHLAAMRQLIAAALGLSAEAVSVKAKTGEGLGLVGEGQVAEAQAVVLIERRPARPQREPIYSQRKNRC